MSRKYHMWHHMLMMIPTHKPKQALFYRLLEKGSNDFFQKREITGYGDTMLFYDKALSLFSACSDGHVV